MCGGGSNTPTYTYTMQEIDIGLGLKHVIAFRDSTMYKQSIKDTYLTENACCWDTPYKHEIKEVDINTDNLRLDINSPLKDKALELLADRRAYMQRKAAKAQTLDQQKVSTCNII